MPGQFAVPVVCIGFSSGGVIPLQEVIYALGPDTGMAFVVIHHLRRTHPTALVPILSRCTPMPVQLAVDGMAVLPDHVYVLSSGDEITLRNGSFSVYPRTKNYGWPNLISLFVDSLSASRHPGIAVILSGMDSDGAESLKLLKRHGGIVLAQLPSTAASADMPQSAIDTGEVDYILAPAEIGAKLNELAQKLQTQPA